MSTEEKITYWLSLSDEDMNRINKLEMLVNRYRLAMRGQVDLQKFTYYELYFSSI
jgi:hypothetical protein